MARAAFIAGLRLGSDRPGVLRRHDDVDHAVVRRLGDDARRLQEALAAKVPLRLREALGAERLALVKEEELANDRSARLDVQFVGEAVDGAAPRLVIGVDVEAAG